MILFFQQLLCSVNPRELRLTPFDDQIYADFRQDFPDLKIGILNEEELKSPTGKETWRKFIEKFDKLDDFSYGTLLRSDASKEFSPENSIFVVRVQFLAIEIARNREGFNDNLKQFYKPPPKEEEK